MVPLSAETQTPGRGRWDLLGQIAAEALEPEYATAPRTGARTLRQRITVALALLVLGALLSGSAAATARSRPESANERAQLIGYVQAGEKDNDTLRDQITALREQISQLQKENLGSGSEADQLRARLSQLEITAGTVAVTGPGLTITIDDADDVTSSSGRILDVDLRQAVNGLWLAGADAVAINGHRITSLSSIRSAGDAITVDYRSLVRPYVVAAIGDPNTLPARWASCSGAAWLNYLKQNYRVRYDWSQAPTVTLPAAAQAELRHASVASTPK